jgi:hypothetical protein
MRLWAPLSSADGTLNLDGPEAEARNPNDVPSEAHSDEKDETYLL